MFYRDRLAKRAIRCGQSTVARLVAAQLPRGMVLEAETLGVWLFEQARQIEPVIDFRDIPLWRPLFASAVAGFASLYGRPIVVPMSIYPPDYLAEVLTHLRAVHAEVHHICLDAQAHTVRDRLRQRGDSPRAYSWNNLDRVLAAFRDAPDEYGIRLSTDGKDAATVAAEVLATI